MKPIRLTDSLKQQALAEFMKTLENQRSNTGKIDFSFNLGQATANKCKALIRMSPIAYLKMMELVKQSTYEIAWHGVVEKINNLEYVITDILCYPQKVTGVTVDSIEEKYGPWVAQLTTLELNNLRFQGHSHVNMAASPSGRDTTNWQEFLSVLPDDDYYIFAIVNKSGNMYWNIYNLAENVLYENSDIDFEIDLDDAYSIDSWAKDAMEEYITKPVTTYASHYQGNYLNPPTQTALASTPTVTKPVTTQTKTIKPLAQQLDDYDYYEPTADDIEAMGAHEAVLYEVDPIGWWDNYGDKYAHKIKKGKGKGIRSRRLS